MTTQQDPTAVTSVPPTFTLDEILVAPPAVPRLVWCSLATARIHVAALLNTRLANVTIKPLKLRPGYFVAEHDTNKGRVAVAFGTDYADVVTQLSTTQATTARAQHVAQVLAYAEHECEEAAGLAKWTAVLDHPSLPRDLHNALAALLSTRRV